MKISVKFDTVIPFYILRAICNNTVHSYGPQTALERDCLYMLTTEMLQVNRIKIKNQGGVQYIKVFSLSNICRAIIIFIFSSVCGPQWECAYSSI